MPSIKTLTKKKTATIGLLFAGTLLLGACGDTGYEKSTAAASKKAPSGAGGSVAGASVTVQNGALGDLLVDSEGMTLYGFTNDSAGAPTCNDDCADAWPALLVENGELPDGLDPAVYSVVDRADGTKQLKAGKWPLYRFAGDGAAGETNGQGSGGVWFAVAPDGSLIKEAPGETTQPTDTGSTDTGSTDTGSTDTGSTDTGSTDTDTDDTDSGSTDTGSTDTGSYGDDGYGDDSGY